MVKELGAKKEVCGINPSHVQKDIELQVLRDFGADIVQQLGTQPRGCIHSAAPVLSGRPPNLHPQEVGHSLLQGAQFPLLQEGQCSYRHTSLELRKLLLDAVVQIFSL